LEVDGGKNENHSDWSMQLKSAPSSGSRRAAPTSPLVSANFTFTPNEQKPKLKRQGRIQPEPFVQHKSPFLLQNSPIYYLLNVAVTPTDPRKKRAPLLERNECSFFPFFPSHCRRQANKLSRNA
jgi:hypothetical protein